MERDRNHILKYWPQYKWSNIIAMVKNNMAMPEISNESFKNKFVVITGATSGIGYYSARKFASSGANILTINKNEEKSQKLCDEIKHDFGVECNYMIADFSKLDEVLTIGEALANQVETIDVLLHNAGLYLSMKKLTVDGLEMNFAVNYLAPFLLTYLVSEKMKSQGSGRIIFVGSEGYRFAIWGLRLDDLNWEKRRYTGLGAYGSSKTAQLLSMMIFNDAFLGSGVTINAMHPGMVRTKTGRDNDRFYLWYKRNLIDRFSRSPEVSAEAIYFLSTSEKLDGISGKFFNQTTEEELAPPAQDREIADQLWEMSMHIGRLR
jgi:NAD(P)-dependent dehydrogenase (short-subunit alcohol dehydrogenase family)